MDEQNQTQKSVFQKPWFYIVIVLILAGVGVGFYLYYATFVPCAEPECYEDSVRTLPQEVPFGVEVVDLENGNRLVKNVEAGYQIEVGGDKYLYKDSINDNNLVIQDFSGLIIDYSGAGGCYVTEETSQGNLSLLEEETQNYCNDREDCTNYSIKTVNLNGINWFEIKYFGEYVGAGLPKLKTEKNGIIYTLYFKCDDSNFINSVINNFSFIIE